MEVDRFRGRNALVWAPFGAAVVCLLAYVAFLAAGSPAGWDDEVNVFAYCGSLAFAALTSLAKAAISPRQRGPWVALGLGLAFWAAGELYWVGVLRHQASIPYPSLADAGYLLAIPCYFTGVAMLARLRVGRLHLHTWVDGVIVACATGAVAVAFMSPALAGLTDGERNAEALTNLAYPLGNVVLLAVVAAAVVIAGTRGAWTLVLIGVGLVLLAGADLNYLYQEAVGRYEEGWADLLWPLGGLAIALSACIALRRPVPAVAEQRASLWLPTLFAMLAVSLLVFDHFHRSHPLAVLLGGATLVLVAARLAQSFRENNRLLEMLQRETITDGLTGLGNRRRLIADLETAVASNGRGVTLAIYDLDGFKAYNDTFGHPAGDALLVQLATRLAEAVIEDGNAYRLGGDEFCVLVRVDGAALAPLVERGRRALTTTGEGFAITASSGHAILGAEATSASAALRIADQRMYTEKAAKSTRMAQQTETLLLGILREREPQLHDHVEGVARNAVRLAHALGLSAEEIDVVRRAAQLHDIGKIAIPSQILDKPGPLEPEEWDLMHRHTEIGERILGAAPALRPVARAVRASHERWDGGGYPDGKAAGEIPIAARIVFLCDAFDAMTSERPYQRAVSEAAAIAELRRMAGKQFDPELVRAFVRIWTGDRKAGSESRRTSV